jgi:hypothetical protein
MRTVTLTAPLPSRKLSANEAGDKFSTGRERNSYEAEAIWKLKEQMRTRGLERFTGRVHCTVLFVVSARSNADLTGAVGAGGVQ